MPYSKYEATETCELTQERKDEIKREVEETGKAWDHSRGHGPMTIGETIFGVALVVGLSLIVYWIATTLGPWLDGKLGKSQEEELTREEEDAIEAEARRIRARRRRREEEE